MMEKKLKKILRNLEMVVKDRKVCKLSIIIFAIISTIICVVLLVKLDNKPNYDTTNRELFNAAEKLVEDGIEIISMRNYNYVITTEAGVITISKNDNSLASILGIEPKVIISMKEDGDYIISKNYFMEEDYNKIYYLNLVLFIIFFIIALTAILFVTEVVLVIVLDLLFTLWINSVIDIKKRKRQKSLMNS